MTSSPVDNGHSPMSANNKEGSMEFLIPLLLIGAWILLQVWVLPRMGFRT